MSTRTTTTSSTTTSSTTTGTSATRTARRSAVTGLLALALVGGTVTTGTAAAGAAAPPSASPPSASATATSAATATAKAPSRPVTDFGYLTRITRTKRGTTLTLDRAIMHTGAAAAAQRKARGLDPTPDFYIQNDNPLLRTFRVAPGVRVYGSQVLTGSPARKRITLTALRSWMVSRPKGRTGPPFTLTFDRKRRIVSIAELYLP